MGGRGSGRTGGFGALIDKTDDYHSVDLAWMRRQGCLAHGSSGALTWSRGETATGSIRYRVELDGLRLLYRTRRPDSRQAFRTGQQGTGRAGDQVAPVV